jgi:hypothetical protein
LTDYADKSISISSAVIIPAFRRGAGSFYALGILALKGSKEALVDVVPDFARENWPVGRRRTRHWAWLCWTAGRARKMHAYEVHARETHAHEVHAHEVHANEMHAYDTHAR